jgi:hypothetical protein
VCTVRPSSVSTSAVSGQTACAQSGNGLALDLSDGGVRKRWAEHGVAGLINAMERCEPWAVDVRPDSRDQAERVLAEMSRQLNISRAAAISDSVTDSPDLMISFMGYMRSGRALALFAWLTEVHPSIPTLLINEARFGGDEFGSILIERITTLEKQHLLSRVFSPERIALVLELLAEAGLGAFD